MTSVKGYEVGDLVRVMTHHESLSFRDCDGKMHTDQFDYDYKYYNNLEEYPLGIVISEKLNFGQTLISVKVVGTGDILECHWYDVETVSDANR